MNKRNPSGNNYRIDSVGLIARGGTNNVVKTFEMPGATANASYKVDFNVICDTRSWPGFGTDIGYITRGSSRATSRRNDYLNSTQIGFVLADHATANRITLTITNLSAVRDYEFSGEITWYPEGGGIVKEI